MLNVGENQHLGYLHALKMCPHRLLVSCKGEKKKHNSNFIVEKQVTH